MEIRLDQQVVTQTCPGCGSDMTVVRGSVYDGQHAVGLYLIALHAEAGEDAIAHLAIALREHGRKPGALAVAMRVTSTPDDVGFALINWDQSPWIHETYLGQMLDRPDALESDRKATFFHVAEHVVNDLPDVRKYLGS